MKRVWFFLGLIVASAVLGGAGYAALRPARTADERKMDWLAQRLALTPQQRMKIWRLHTQQCPMIGKLGAECRVASPDAEQRCRRATERLVQAVSAELTPAQRTEYLQLVSSCLESGAVAPERR